MKGIAGTGSLAIPLAFSQVRHTFLCDSIGWYYSWYFSVCSCLWYDDFGNLPTHQVE